MGFFVAHSDSDHRLTVHIVPGPRCIFNEVLQILNLKMILGWEDLIR